MKDEDFYWYWLTNIRGIGRDSIRNLLYHYGSPKAVYQAEEEEVFLLLRTKRQREGFQASKREGGVAEGLERLSEKNLRFLHPDSPDYPQRLREIPDAPYSLYLAGKLPQEGQKAVSVIGARNCSRYGLEMARYFGRELAKCGVAIVSGLARGVDGMAHVGALEADGYTLGIVGGGIDQIYPMENYHLFMQMRERGGILSESNTGVKPVSGLFPQRNRLIAGLCDGILVVEAMEKSGTFITVDQGLEQGKEIFALPGRVTDEKSAGCNRLIKAGANIVTEVSDILQILRVETENMEKNRDLEVRKEIIPKITLAPHEKMVYSCLEIEPKYIDCIIYEARLAPQEVSRILNRLTLRGVVLETEKNYYAVRI